MHLVFTISIIVYVNEIYIMNSGGDSDANYKFTMILLAGIIYPMFYDFSQLMKQGSEYFEDIWNYNDFLLIQFSLINILLQNLLGPFHLACKVCMIIIIFQVLFKAFFFMRILDKMSYIVTMITVVLYDLRIFLYVFAVLILSFSLVYGIMG